MKKPNFKNIIIFIFSGFILLTGILYFVLPDKNFSSTEKRYLAQFPDFKISNLKSGKFTNDFENYLADQAPFRSLYVSVNAYLNLLKGNNGSNGIYLCKNGWLIEKPFSENNNFEKNLKQISDFCSETEIPCSMMVVPLKGDILKKYLPKNALSFNEETYYEKLKNNRSFEYIDIFTSFKECNVENLYYKTDHHWTSVGAFEAYKSFCRTKGFSEPDIKKYNVEVYDDFYGTSYAKSCYSFTKPDTLEIFRNKNTEGKAKVEITEGKKTAEYDNIFFENNLLTEDKYTVFLDGNHSMVKIESENNGGKIILIKDSFAHCFAPFLADNYSEIIMIDLRYFEGSVSELIKEEKVDEILFLYGLDNLATSNDIILR